jgi:DNA invertase Pin-like site-specific DNA recombinase
MITTAERAGRWLRVSSGGQDEANQEPDINGWIASHGYEDAETYQLHGKSASKGKQDKELNRVVADMRRGHIGVLVVWQSSRIERRGAYSVFDLARRVKEAGGRIEYVQDAYLNETNEMSDVMLALAATKDKQKSLDISKQVLAAHQRSRGNHALTGKYTWGYASEGPKYERRMITTAEGEKYVPQVFTRIADGQSLVEVAAWLSEQTGHTWHARSIAKMIRNTAYRGEHRDAKGNTICKCPPLAGNELWNRANASLDARPSARRGQRSDLDGAGAAVLSGIAGCGNPGCDATGAGPSPMYRIVSGSGNQERIPFYRCSGRTGRGAPKRRGCGCMVPVADADALLDKAMTGLLRPVLRPVFHPATGYAIELGDIAQALRDLPAQGLDEDAEDAERARLRAERRRLDALPKKAAWTEWVPVLDADGKPDTWGAKWARSDRAARRTWLREAGFALYLSRPDMDVEDNDDDADDLSRTDVHEGDRAVLTFGWDGDEDAGLARGLPYGAN